MRRSIIMLCAVTLAAVLLTSADLASAKKPAPPPPSEPPTEGIYFRDDAWYVMSPDGSDKTALDVGGIPSRELHGDQRWHIGLLKVGDGTYPDGSPHRQLFTGSGDGDESSIVQLTSDTSVQFSRQPGLLDWAPGDEAVTYVAHKWEYDESADEWEVVEAGIYMLPIAFDDDGNVTGADGDPVLVVASGTTELESGEYIVHSELGFSWSPDGEEIVYGTWGTNWVREVRVTAVESPGSSTLLATGADHPSWSVDDVIGYGNGLEIKIVNPDGTGAKTIITAKNNTNVGWPRFSPDGNSIVYIVLSYEGTQIPYTYSYGIYTTSVSKPRAKDLDTTIRGDGPLNWR